MPIAPNKFDKSNLPPGGGGIGVIEAKDIKKEEKSTGDSDGKEVAAKQPEHKDDKEQHPKVVQLPLHKVRALAPGPVVMKFDKDPETGEVRMHH